MRTIINANYSWNFENKLVDLPHSLSMLDESYFKNSDVTVKGTYTKTFCLDLSQVKDKVVVLRFKGASAVCKVFCNDKHVKTNYCPYNEFDVELNGYELIQNSKAVYEIRAEVDAKEDETVPPFGYQLDYLCFGGLYRGVELLILDKEHIKLLNVTGNMAGEVRIDLQTTEKEPSVTYELYDPRGNLVLKTSKKEELKVESPQLWDLGKGLLYKLVVKYKDDELSKTFGFRDAKFTTEGFFINGRKVKLFGANRHQSYPYVGYAMAENLQIEDARLVMKTGMNIVRTSHYMQSTAFLDECDRLGLLVFEEIPGWQHVSKDPVWRERVVENVRFMIQRDKSHPSIVLWGVRINESPDDDELYSKTNELAHKLDPSRQTGGVRYLPNSHLLEDVYTFNDFIHNGKNQGLRDPKAVHKTSCPHLVTEYCGHTYSTKRFDDELHRQSHALRHAKVLNDMFANPNICGCITWCLFDYNTHSDFGSGDMICHHGIYDMHRINKLASFAYLSQNSEAPVLELSSLVDDGDCAMNAILPNTIFTNADSVRLYANEEYLGTYTPDTKNFGALPHAPVQIPYYFEKRLIDVGFKNKKDRDFLAYMVEQAKVDPSGKAIKKHALKILLLALKVKKSIPDFIQMITNIQSFTQNRKPIWRFEAIKDNKVVKTQVIDPDAPLLFNTALNTNVIKLSDWDTYQVVQIKIFVTKEGCSTILPYFFDSLCVSVEGPLELYGSKSLVTIVGGTASVYLRTTQKTGEARVLLHSSKLGDKTLNVTIGD